jgi:hypothetical protein
MCGPNRGLSFLLAIDVVSGSLKPEDRKASSVLFSLPTLAADAANCPDGVVSSTAPPCSEEPEDDDTATSGGAVDAGPPNIWIHWSRGTDKRPEMDSGYREITFAGFMSNLTNESSALSNLPARNFDTASNALVRFVRLSFNDASISKALYEVDVYVPCLVKGQRR